MTAAYISDVVLDGEGSPVVGAEVTLLRAADYGAPPTMDPGPGSANYIAQTVSAAGGSFSFDHIPYDDYHLMVKYEGKTIFRYNLAALPVEATDTKSTAGRCLVPRTLTKIIRGDDVTIHFIGDSITLGYNSTGVVGGGFVQRMGVLVGQQLAPDAQVNRYDPNAYGSLNDGPINGWNGPTPIQAASHGSAQLIQIVNNAVSGDTIQRVLRRYGNLTGWTPTIDLYVILLGINDSLASDNSKFVRPEDFAGGIRSLADILHVYYPMAEVVVCTPHANDQPDAGCPPNGITAGEYALDDYAMAARIAALDLGLALVDLRQLWNDARNSGNTSLTGSDFYPPTWLDNAGGNHTHPSDQGHQVIAEEMFKIFGTPGLAAGRSQRIQTLGPRARYKELEVVRLPLQNPALVFAGTWASDGAGDIGPLYYSGELQKSSHAGDTLTFSLRMQDGWLLVRRGRDCGQIAVSVDGGPAAIHDLYRAYPTNIADTVEADAVYPLDRIAIAHNLQDGDHTIVVTVLGTSSPGSSGSAVYVDGIEYSRQSYSARKLECPQEVSTVQYGAFTCTIVDDYSGETALSFPRPFRSGNVPSVVAVTNQIDHYCTVDGITNEHCNIRTVRRDGSVESTVVTGQWIGIG